jgi:hypothetical protein
MAFQPLMRLMTSWRFPSCGGGEIEDLGALVRSGLMTCQLTPIDARAHFENWQLSA